MVTGRDIEAGLLELGLGAGDLVVVHSSLSSFGRVVGGADTVVEALLSVLGPEGTLVVPTFSYRPEFFDPDLTPSVVGAITEAVRKRDDSKRSLHPTHSVAAIGPLSEDIIKDHEKTTPFGQGSALYRLLELNGKVLLIGVGHTTNSIIHVAEELAEAPYLERVRQVIVALPNGRRVARIVRRPGCSQGFGRIADRLEATGTVRRLSIGRSLAQLIPAGAIVGTAISMLKENPAALLCERPDCQTCAEARAMTAAMESQANEEALAALLKEPVGENIQPFECSHLEEMENGSNRN